jgi:small conductance mechanosensitive channel
MLLAIVSEEPRIVNEPEPFVGLGAITTKSIEVHLKVWVSTDDYNSVMYDLNESIYKSLTEAEFHFLVD